MYIGISEDENIRVKINKNHVVRDIGLISMYLAQKINEDNNWLFCIDYFNNKLLYKSKL